MARTSKSAASADKSPKTRASRPAKKNHAAASKPAAPAPAEVAADTTHFGFQTVSTRQKTGMVRSVFNSVASKYDIMNDFMSAGLHRRWKDTFVELLAPQPGQRFLDVAGGTGDIALRIHKILASQQAGAGSTQPDRQQASETAGIPPVTVLDINEQMLLHGRDRSIDDNWRATMRWLCGNAERLPLPDGCMDRYTIAFGIRNVTDIPAALSEAYRVLDHGGRFMCLEFSNVENPLLAKAYDLYSFHAIPKIGELVANDAASYQYLVESIRRFPSRAAFARMIESAGFRNVNAYPLMGGVVAIHSGWKV